MEYTYRALEDEALDIAGYDIKGGLGRGGERRQGIIRYSCFVTVGLSIEFVARITQSTTSQGSLQASSMKLVSTFSDLRVFTWNYGLQVSHRLAGTEPAIYKHKGAITEGSKYN
jgi:hypothetical protein